MKKKFSVSVTEQFLNAVLVYHSFFFKYDIQWTFEGNPGRQMWEEIQKWIMFNHERSWFEVVNDVWCYFLCPLEVVIRFVGLQRVVIYFFAIMYPSKIKMCISFRVSFDKILNMKLNLNTTLQSKWFLTLFSFHSFFMLHHVTHFIMSYFLLDYPCILYSLQKG